MRISLILLFQLVLMGQAYGQLHLDDPDYTYQSVDGTVLQKDKVNDLLHSRQHYSLKETEVEDGKFLVTLVPISDKEFHQIIKEKKRLAREMKGQKVPDYSLEDQQGQPITNHTFDYQKVTVYNFWFTTCPHCIEEIPKLNQLVRQFSKEVTFIAPTFNTHTQVATFLAKNEFDYQIVTSAKSLAEDMHIRSYPSHYLIDQNGIIRKVIIGSSNHVIRKVKRNIRKLLREAS
ncbi:MAG: TlpA disulfide reductase family protein [Bacteroidota bacterium]